MGLADAGAPSPARLAQFIALDRRHRERRRAVRDLRQRHAGGRAARRRRRTSRRSAARSACCAPASEPCGGSRVLAAACRRVAVGRRLRPQRARRGLRRGVAEVAADPDGLVLRVVRGRRAERPAGKEGLAFLTGEMLADAGDRTNSSTRFSKTLYPLAAGYERRVDRSAPRQRPHAPRQRWTTYLRAASSTRCSRPAFDEDDFERMQADAINDLENTLRYSSDEELGKAALTRNSCSAARRYAHSERGHGRGLESRSRSTTSRQVLRQHYTRDNALVGLGGGYDDASSRAPGGARTLPAAAPDCGRRIQPDADPGPHVALIDEAGRGRVDQLRLSDRSCTAASAISTRSGSRTRGSASTAISRATYSK